jgi:hypothetical protein
MYCKPKSGAPRSRSNWCSNFSRQIVFLSFFREPSSRLFCSLASTPPTNIYIPSFEMDPSQSTTIPSPRLAEMSNGLCFELIQEMLSHLPLTTIDRQYQRFDPVQDSNLTFSGVSKNFLTVGRSLAFYQVSLKTKDEARRFLAALQSNEEFAERNPGWPRMNSTRSLFLGASVGGLSYTSLTL